MFFLIVEVLVTTLACVFLLYALLELRSVRKSRKQSLLHFQTMNAPSDGSTLPTSSDWPRVSVLLPVCNEKHVVAKLLQAVACLRYPDDQLEILVLDDSTDETCQIIDETLAHLPNRNIRHLRRPERTGYKAGNLSFGLTKARGDFIAIFDADCLPSADFLVQAMPCFADSEVGFLQTGIRSVNSDTSFLTRFQALEAGHKEDVTTGLSEDGFMASLTGSSCIWRRTCIEAIGGISAATITEDVDMGYKAQLTNWKYVWLGNVTSQAEFPETMAAFRVQRQRWARGLIQNALRHVREVFARPMPFLKRLYALSLMFSALLLAAFYLILLLCLPVALLVPAFSPFFHGACTLFLGAACVWGWNNTSPLHKDTQSPAAPAASTTTEDKEDNTSANKSGNNFLSSPQALRALLHRLAWSAGYVLMHFPISLYYFTAALQVFCHRDSGFHRTPKGSGRKKVSQPRINKILLYLEIASFCYALVSCLTSLSTGLYWVTFYSGLCLAGFALSLFFSFSDSRKELLPTRILITGASGSLGSALAKHYAGPGKTLILQGRNREALSQIARICRARGALVEEHILDLSSSKAVHAWMTALCTRIVPDLVLANAGRNTDIGVHGEGEPLAEAQALVQVNLLSVMTLFDAVLPFFRQQKAGQFAIISSLAGYYGLAMTPTYCATKAALKSYGTSLRAWLLEENIHVNAIFPGYVASPMCAAMPGPKPFLMQPEKAARIIRKGLERDQARISFPFPLNLGVWGLGLLPVCCAMPIARLLGYGRR